MTNKERSISFPCGNITLEGQLNPEPGTRGAIICHPHPQYGGNMDNQVVLTIARAFAQQNIATLRFNFRGTGSSTGMFDNGEGEQEDVRAAVTFMNEKGYTDVWLAGYSFGARMNAAVVAAGCTLKDHIMVSPPAGFMSFNDIKTLPDTGLIITGGNDDIAPPDVIQGHIKRWGIDPTFEIIDGCDHFYSGCLEDLYEALDAYLS